MTSGEADKACELHPRQKRESSSTAACRRIYDGSATGGRLFLSGALAERRRSLQALQLSHFMQSIGAEGIGY